MPTCKEHTSQISWSVFHWVIYWNETQQNKFETHAANTNVFPKSRLHCPSQERYHRVWNLTERTQTDDEVAAPLQVRWRFLAFSLACEPGTDTRSESTKRQRKLLLYQRLQHDVKIRKCKSFATMDTYLLACPLLY